MQKVQLSIHIDGWYKNSYNIIQIKMLVLDF